MRIVEWVKVRRSKLQGPECPWCEKTRLRKDRRRVIEINPRGLRGDQRHFSVMRNPTIMMPRPITMFHHEIFGIG